MYRYMSPERIQGSAYNFSSGKIITLSALVRPQLFALNCSLTTVRPLLFALNCLPQTNSRPNSDVWSFGVTVVECARGKFPYPPASNFFELLESVVEQPCPELTEEEGFSSVLVQYVHRCLQKDPKDRLPVEALLDHPFVCGEDHPTEEEMCMWSNEVLDVVAEAKPVFVKEEIR
jgi:serine/threonine protein kinase